MNLNLSGPETQQFQDVLLSAFPEHDNLEQMVRFRLDENLNTIIAAGNHRDHVFQLINWAEREGRQDELLRAARQANPGNPALANFANWIARREVREAGPRRLGPQLYQDCLNNLRRYNLFDSADALQALFAADPSLAPLQPQLSALSCEDRIKQLVDHLLPCYLSDGRLAFLYFLDHLRVRYPQDEAVRQDIAQLTAQIDAQLQTIARPDIWYVVAAMTRIEAEPLFNGSLIPERFPPFEHELRDYLTQRQQHINDLLSCYSPQRADWQPTLHHSGTIRDTLIDTINQLNRKVYGQLSDYMICPRFVSDDCFSDNAAILDRCWKALTKPGAIVVVIIDPLSLFHQTVKEGLIYGMQVLGDREALLVFSPVNHRILPMHRMIEDEVSQHFRPAFMRFDQIFDPRCEVGVADIRSLKRWLFAILPDAVKTWQDPPATEENLAYMRQIGKTAGIKRVVFGRGPG